MADNNDDEIRGEDELRGPDGHDHLDDLVNRAMHDMEVDPELEDEDPSDVYDDFEDEDDYPPEQGSVNLAGANLSHTISDEAGTRLDLTDIHGGALKPIEMSQEMKTSFLEYSMSVIAEMFVMASRSYAVAGFAALPLWPCTAGCCFAGGCAARASGAGFSACPLSRPHPQTTTANAMTAIALPFFIFTPLIFMMSCA